MNLAVQGLMLLIHTHAITSALTHLRAALAMPAGHLPHHRVLH